MFDSAATDAVHQLQLGSKDPRDLLIEDMRRAPRIDLCCRALVRDRYGVWSGVTDNVSPRGCRIVTERLLRKGAGVHLTLASDLIEDELEVLGETVWASFSRLALVFSGRDGFTAAREWIARVIEAGSVGSGSRTRVVPVVRSTVVPQRRPTPLDSPRVVVASPASLATSIAKARSGDDPEGVLIRLPPP